MSVATSRAPSRVSRRVADVAPASRTRRKARRGRFARARALLATTRGTCTAHGLEGAFELTHDARGTTFVERVTLECGDGADALTTASGRDDDGKTWDADWYGDCRATALDGAHASAMMTWVRTNQWNDELAARGTIAEEEARRGGRVDGGAARVRRRGAEGAVERRKERTREGEETNGA